MSHVKNLPYAVANGGTPNYGTDIEFATLAGKKYALAGSYKNGLQIVDISDPAERADRLDLRLRRHAGRRPGLPPGRRARPHVRRLRVRHVRRRHLDLLPRGAGARLRHAQGGRDGQERHVHRRRHRSAAPEDRRLRRGRPGLAQPVDPPERQLPLQLQLGPDHVDPAGDRGLRHLRPGRPEVRRRALAAAAARPRHRVARHHVLRRRQARLLGRALPGRDHRHARPRQPGDHLVLPGPDDQRLAPDGPVHDHRREPAASASS